MKQILIALGVLLFLTACGDRGQNDPRLYPYSGGYWFANEYCQPVANSTSYVCMPQNKPAACLAQNLFTAVNVNVIGTKLHVNKDGVHSDQVMTHAGGLITSSGGHSFTMQPFYRERYNHMTFNFAPGCTLLFVKTSDGAQIPTGE